MPGSGSAAATRRESRGPRITAAVALLVVATAVMVGALTLRTPFVVGAAGVFALAMAWAALRLAWMAIVSGRAEHASDRTELAQAYRNLFAERAVEHAEFVDAMATRLAQRDHALLILEGNVATIRMRAVEAEASAASSTARLAHAHDQIAAMDALITAAARRPAAGATEETRSTKPPMRGARREGVVPEWAALEPDPVRSLMAWEQHASQVSDTAEAPTRGRHAAG